MAGSLNLEILQPHHDAMVHEFLLSNDKNLLYYSTNYKKFIADLLDCKAEYWIALEGNTIVGMLPLMYKTGKYGISANSLPFYGSNGGILADNAEAHNLLLNKYKEIVSDKNICSSNLITHPLIKADYSDLAYTHTDERIGQITSFNCTIENCESELMESFHYKTRNMIRKGLKSVSEISVDNQAFDFLKNIHNENMKSIGGKPKSDRFFELIAKHFTHGKDYNIYIAKEGKGEKMSALLLFYFNKTVEYFTPVIKHEYRDAQPLSALIYQSMIDARRNGYLFWNWGGTWKSQEGVYRFKSRWNSTDYPYYYYNKINNQLLYDASPTELLNEYPDFYVLPFNVLKSEKI